MTYQSLTIAGRLGRDVEARYTPGGDMVATFPVAADHTYTNRQGERVKSTTWFRVSVFGRQAENANQYLSKGRLVLVEGRLNADPATGGPRVYEASDGAMRTGFEIVCEKLTLLPNGKAGNGAARTNTPVSATEDAVPF